MNGFDRLSAVAAVCCALFVPSHAQVPPEVTELLWCPGTKNCLEWPASPGATAYHVYRGATPGIPSLVDGSMDSCAVGTFAATTTGPSIDDPAALAWFLVTASNASGEGSAGAGSATPRFVDSTGDCAAAEGLVINEVDYDQPGTDVSEFVEVYNAGSSARDLTDVALVLVNGLSSFEYARVDLAAAATSLAPGEFLVVGTADVIAGLPAGTPATTWAAATNNIQNGAPDGIALVDLGSGALLDALSYEGTIADADIDGLAGTYDLVEGTPAGAQDSNSQPGSLARLPNGSDTDDADTDWSFVATPSPGAANTGP